MYVTTKCLNFTKKCLNSLLEIWGRAPIVRALLHDEEDVGLTSPTGPKHSDTQVNCRIEEDD
jgi:hypothetical protein